MVEKCKILISCKECEFCDRAESNEHVYHICRHYELTTPAEIIHKLSGNGEFPNFCPLPNYITADEYYTHFLAMKEEQ